MSFFLFPSDFPHFNANEVDARIEASTRLLIFIYYCEMMPTFLVSSYFCALIVHAVSLNLYFERIEQQPTETCK